MAQCLRHCALRLFGKHAGDCEPLAALMKGASATEDRLALLTAIAAAGKACHAAVAQHEASLVMLAQWLNHALTTPSSSTPLEPILKVLDYLSGDGSSFVCHEPQQSCQISSGFQNLYLSAASISSFTMALNPGLQ